MVLPTSLLKRGGKKEKKKKKPSSLLNTHHYCSFAWKATAKNRPDVIQVMFMRVTSVVFLTAWKESVMCENRLFVHFISVEVIFFSFVYMI